jgi:hypothetical protein
MFQDIFPFEIRVEAFIFQGNKVQRFDEKLIEHLKIVVYLLILEEKRCSTNIPISPMHRYRFICSI